MVHSVEVEALIDMITSDEDKGYMLLSSCEVLEHNLDDEIADYAEWSFPGGLVETLYYDACAIVLFSGTKQYYFVEFFRGT